MWYFKLYGENIGPVPWNDILDRYQRGQLKDDSQVRESGKEDWRPLLQVLKPAAESDEPETSTPEHYGAQHPARDPDWDGRAWR